MSSLSIRLGALLASLTLGLVGLRAGAPEASARLSVGIPPSLFRDLSFGQVRFITGEFRTLVREFAGLEGRLVPRLTLHDAGSKLAAGLDQFAIFEGVEFAWVQERQPTLRPLVMLQDRQPHCRAVLVVRAESAVESLADLPSEAVAREKHCRQHLRLFFRKQADGDPDMRFEKCVVADHAEMGLDWVILGKAQAMVVDESRLETYREINPGKYRRLRVIARSIPFPPTVIAYDLERTPPAMVQAFRDGLLRANTSIRGRDMIRSFRVTAFRPAPNDLGNWLLAIRDSFPDDRVR